MNEKNQACQMVGICAAALTVIGASNAQAAVRLVPQTFPTIQAAVDSAAAAGARTIPGVAMTSGQARAMLEFFGIG